MTAKILKSKIRNAGKEFSFSACIYVIDYEINNVIQWKKNSLMTLLCSRSLYDAVSYLIDIIQRS